MNKSTLELANQAVATINLKGRIFSISESKMSSLGEMTFCVKWYLPDKRQIRTRPRLGTSSDFVVLVDLKGFEPTTLRMRTN